MSVPAPILDAVSREAELLEAAPQPASSTASERWDVLTRLLGLADVGAGFMAGVAAGDLLGLPAGRHLAFALVTSLAWALLCFACGLSARKELRVWASGLPDAARLLTSSLAMSWVFVGLAAVAGARTPLAAALAGPGVAILSGLTRAVVRGFVHRLSPLRQRTLIIGSGRVAGDIAATLLRHRELGLEPIGIVDDDVHDVGGPELVRLGTLADLPEILRRHAVDRAIIAFSRATHAELLQSIRVCRDGGVAIDIVPRLFEFLDGAQAVDQVGGVPLLSIGVPQLGRGSRAAKRALDVTVAAGLLVALAPALAVIALAIRLSSPGPVLFRQPRTGRSGELFELLKFRSMHADAEARKGELMLANAHADGLMFKIDRDPRITRVGRLLRKTSLDELPQLANVLAGQMSLVGPRPLIPQETANLDEDWHARRMDLRPGITGLWQISGRSDVTFRDMVRLDYQYVAGWSVARDLEILLATMPAVVGGRGAY